MPLLDHFQPPARIRAPWESLGHSWVTRMMAYLNRLLPRDRYQAFSSVHLGAEAEADIAEFEVPGDWSTRGDGGVATLAAPPVVTVEAAIPDEFEVEVKDVREGMSLVGVIEFISPANKDRPETREKLVSKALTYLDLGIGVILVDIVTNRLVNLHNELVVALKVRKAARLPDDAPTYVAGYRPTREDGRWTIDMWPYVAPVGAIVPTVPLALKGGPLVPVDLEGTYCAALADHNL
jgi:hypothetical protein